MGCLKTAHFSQLSVYGRINKFNQFFNVNTWDGVAPIIRARKRMTKLK